MRKSKIRVWLTTVHNFFWGKRWKRFLTGFILGVVLLAALVGTTIEVTNSPEFCNICHSMQPFYDSWAKSSHSHVDCRLCHIPPGWEFEIKSKFASLAMVSSYFTGDYKKNPAWGGVSDKSCMREGCHDTRTLSGIVEFKKGIRFDHTPHLDGLRNGKKLNCTSCHSQIVQGSHLSVTESTCFLCHFKNHPGQAGLDRCTQCHEPPSAKGRNHVSATSYNHDIILGKKILCRKCHGNMVVGDGAVSKMLCSGCHSDEGKINTFQNDRRMHEVHIERQKIDCHKCHFRIQHKSVSRTVNIKPDCKSCHPDFHNLQLELFSGKGGRGVADQPSPMYVNGLNCQACHMFHQSSGNFRLQGETVTADSRSCEPCHGSGYNQFLSKWKSQTGKAMNTLENVLDIAGSIVERNWKKPVYADAEKILKDARYNYKLVKFGNSIHNIAFANRLMEKSYQLARQSIELLGGTAKLPKFRIGRGLVPGDCTNCHSGLKIKDIKVFGSVYNHANHLAQGLSCNKCHSNRQTHGQLIIDHRNCMSCHHRNASVSEEFNCRTCHPKQYQVYYSRLDYFTYNMPNVMSEKVSCGRCHRDEENNLNKPAKILCSQCHDTSYEDKMRRWQEEIFGLLEQLRVKVYRENCKQGDVSYDTLQLLEHDGTKGVHNPHLYKRLLKNALE